VTKFCCANTILSPPTPPEKNLVKHRLAENSESASGCHRGSEKEGGGVCHSSSDKLPPLFGAPEKLGALLNNSVQNSPIILIFEFFAGKSRPPCPQC